MSIFNKNKEKLSIGAMQLTNKERDRQKIYNKMYVKTYGQKVWNIAKLQFLMGEGQNWKTVTPVMTEWVKDKQEENLLNIHFINQKDWPADSKYADLNNKKSLH